MNLKPRHQYRQRNGSLAYIDRLVRTWFFRPSHWEGKHLAIFSGRWEGPVTWTLEGTNCEGHAGRDIVSDDPVPIGPPK